MEWKPITYPAGAEDSYPQSWQGVGARGDYILTALTSQFFAGIRDEVDGTTADHSLENAAGLDAVVGYLITGPVSTFLDSAVRVSETGKHRWRSKAEYQVPEAELLVTAKAFCEYYEVNGEFPNRRTWKAQAALYFDVVAWKATPPIRLVAEDLGEAEDSPEDGDEELSEEARCETARTLLWSENSAAPSPEEMRSAPAMFAVFDEPMDDASGEVK